MHIDLAYLLGETYIMTLQQVNNYAVEKQRKLNGAQEGPGQKKTRRVNKRQVTVDGFNGNNMSNKVETHTTVLHGNAILQRTLSVSLHK